MWSGPLSHTFSPPPTAVSMAPTAAQTGQTALNRGTEVRKCPHPGESGQGRMALRRSDGGGRRCSKNREEDRLELHPVGRWVGGTPFRLGWAAELPVEGRRGAVLWQGGQDSRGVQRRGIGYVVPVAESQGGDVHRGRDPGSIRSPDPERAAPDVGVVVMEESVERLHVVASPVRTPPLLRSVEVALTQVEEVLSCGPEDNGAVAIAWAAGFACRGRVGGGVQAHRIRMVRATHLPCKDGVAVSLGAARRVSLAHASECVGGCACRTGL